MDLDSIGNLASIGLGEVVSSGLEAVVSGIASTASATGPEGLEDLAALFSADAPDLPAKSELVGGLAGYPDPLAFCDAAAAAGILDLALVPAADVRKLLADLRFDPMAGLAECVRGLFGERGILDRCAGWTGSAETGGPTGLAEPPGPGGRERSLQALDQMEATVRETLRLHDRIGDGLGGRITG